jgi:membrane protein
MTPPAFLPLAWWRRLQAWRGLSTLRTLLSRVREDRLALTAGGLTFASLISAVPLVTVMLALFAAFPTFGTLQDALQRYFVSTLMPDTIVRPVLNGIHQFSTRANRLGAFGLGALLVSALAVMLTIDRTLNNIWRVKRPRPLSQRILVYWSAITLAPLVLMASLAATSAAIPEAAVYFGDPGAALRAAVGVGELVVIWIGAAALFHYVPNTHVLWRDALLGGLFVSLGLAAAKRGLAAWFEAVSTYNVVYGAFATVPIVLVWVYLSWLVVLVGAIVAAYVPVARSRVARLPDAPGSAFALALLVAGVLAEAQRGGGRGLSVARLSGQLGVDPLQVDAALETLAEIDWVGRLEEDEPVRHVLLVPPAQTPVAPLVDALLVDREADVAAFRAAARLDALTLADALPPPAAWRTPAGAPAPQPATASG